MFCTQGTQHGVERSSFLLVSYSDLGKRLLVLPAPLETIDNLGLGHHLARWTERLKDTYQALVWGIQSLGAE